MNAGKALMLAGAMLFLGGLLFQLRLPGDIVIRGKNSVFYFPVVTCLLLSALGSLVLWLLTRKPN